MKPSNKVMTTLSLSAILLVTGCSANNNVADVTPRPIDTSSATSTATATTPAPVYTSEVDTPIVAQPTATTKAGTPTKPEPVNDGKGEYLQTTVSDNDSVMKLKPSVLNDGAQQAGEFPFPDYEAGQKFVAKFIAEEIIDSNLTGNDNDEQVDKWWAANKDKFDRSSQTAVYDSLKSNSAAQTLVLRNSLLGEDKMLAYGTDKQHITDRTIEIISVKDNYEVKGVTFKAATDFKVNKIIDGVETKTSVKGDITLTLVQDMNRQWTIVSGVSVFQFS